MASAEPAGCGTQLAFGDFHAASGEGVDPFFRCPAMLKDGRIHGAAFLMALPLLMVTKPSANSIRTELKRGLAGRPKASNGVSPA